ncbi:sugar transferase, PEP-CTERM/EpsH1 system associated [Sphingomonas guangdongensis]|uniref:Sugar transferase, PEP-CTERM/EpsH1 system associated n=1 Tax=Sphingomonas guangdongensis TaxID=1141890 RepID=A0A285R1J1_9SPHN|nr:TIGR03087 family PEP-CTERM/XrtA system glycosyltransferase [Sphingomonas guangdongensis]SOB87609.1 sugar transferase, PEP-CTERM/EpsH1 system associated [Sphingomonas guangdongensis]
MGEVLFLAHRAPFPPDRGDRIRAYHVVRHLAARHRVHLVAFVDEAGEADHPDLTAMAASHTLVTRTKSRPRAAVEALASGRSVSVAAFADAAIARAVARVLAERPIDAVYVYSSAMAQYLPHGPRPRTVMDFCDVDSVKFGEYARAAGPAGRWLYAREERLLGAFDRGVAAGADASLFVSAAEAQLFRSIGGTGNIQVVENGIDTAFFDPVVAVEEVPAAEPLIVFTGQMDYAPNVAAVSWFANDVLPLIRARQPTASFAIVGRAPVAEVRALGERPGVTVTGEVADVRGWLKAASVAVAPLRIARGIQNKVLEAMAMARPVVATPGAAEGIDHAGTLCVADSEQAFAQAVSGLLSDPVRAVTLGRAARARVQARYGWSARLAGLDALLGLEDAGEWVRTG